MTGTIKAQTQTRRWSRMALQLCAGLACVAGVVHAETVVTDDQVSVRESNVDRPGRGMSMKAVEAKFGAPLERHAAVGKPPITRWDYSGFAVFFEYEHVIDAVVSSGS
jgi:hypothetical protein